MAKKSKKEMNWGQISSAIASKIEEEAKHNPPKMWSWSWSNSCQPRGHFFSALVFAMAALWSLNSLGYTNMLPWWIQGLLILSFAFMFS
jgi:hypothetical protein